MRRIAGDDGEPRHTVFEPELVVRSSCAPPSGAVAQPATERIAQSDADLLASPGA
jgi:hypothetical protein